MSSTEFTYLASPYTVIDKDTGKITNDEATMQKRFEEVCEAAAFLMETRREVIFCPIAHSHPIAAKMVKPGAATDASLWKYQDAPYVELCSKMIVLMLPGWERSRGVDGEIKRAKERGIPIEYLKWPL